MSDRTIQRHVEELVEVSLLTKEERPGYTNILYIEDISEEEAHRYEEKFLREDNNVSPGATIMSPEVIRREGAYGGVWRDISVSQELVCEGFN